MPSLGGRASTQSVKWFSPANMCLEFLIAAALVLLGQIAEAGELALE